MLRRKLPLILLSAALLASACHRSGGAARTYADAPVILISVDTVRADHLPMFGYKRGRDSEPRRLRRTAPLHERLSHVPLTLPSHGTILTGLIPPDNGLRNNIGYHLDPQVPTLPWIPEAARIRHGGRDLGVRAPRQHGPERLFDDYDDAIQNKPGTAVGSCSAPGFTT